MSTIKTDTLQNVAGTKSVPVNTVVDGSAKAWVNFNGTGTVAIRQAFNVGSITDNGVGSYAVNFTTAMPDASYASTGSAANTTSGKAVVSTFNASTTGISITTGPNLSGGANEDSSAVSVAIFR